MGDLISRLSLAARYVRGRQCRNGGFCFYRHEHLEEPNLFDTWHALKSLDILDVEPPRQSAIDGWLEGIDSAALNRAALYYWTSSRRLIRPTWAPDDRVWSRIEELPLLPPRRAGDLSGPLAGLLHMARLKSAFSHVEPAPLVVDWLHRHHHGGYGEKPNLQDTARALELLEILGTPDRSDDTREFVESLQSTSWGFNNTLDSTYCRLGTLLAGVRCCARLGLPVRNVDVIRSIVSSAQRADGAFADVPGALSTLESHHHALALLKALVACDQR